MTLLVVTKIILGLIGGFFIFLCVIFPILVWADYMGHLIAYRTFGDSHFERCDRGPMRCPVSHLKGSKEKSNVC